MAEEAAGRRRRRHPLAREGPGCEPAAHRGRDRARRPAPRLPARRTRRSAVAKEIDAAAPDNLDALAALGRVSTRTGQRQAGAERVHPHGAHRGVRPGLADADRPLSARGEQPSTVRRTASRRRSPADPTTFRRRSCGVELDLRSGELAKAEQRARAIAEPGARIAPSGISSSAMLRWRGRTTPKRSSAIAPRSRRKTSTDGALRLFGAQLQAGNVKAGNPVPRVVDPRASADDRVARSALAEGYLRVGNLSAARAALRADPSGTGRRRDRCSTTSRTSCSSRATQKAMEYAERAHELAPSNASIQDTLGWTLVQRGQVEQGIRHLRDARLRAPQSTEIRYHLAAALAKAGRPDEARKELEPILGAVTTLAMAADARKLAQELGLR